SPQPPPQPSPPVGEREAAFESLSPTGGEGQGEEASIGGALVEDTLLAQFGIKVGSEVRIGDLRLPVAGSLQKVPGETVVMATISPRVYIPLADLSKRACSGAAAWPATRFILSFRRKRTCPRSSERFVRNAKNSNSA